MSFRIIQLCRGDTYQFLLSAIDTDSEDGVYHLQDTDMVYLGVMRPHDPFEKAIIKRSFTKDDMDSSGQIRVRINAEDTINLLPGVYYYAVKLVQDRGLSTETVTTIIKNTKFVIHP